ncbi:MAG: PQQ-dependent sugar dehydrogenase, partial [Actinomycetota bacterium]|nr:PQQ-dependent sugar dehydrogenase [Actinomycetota bacterium]
MPRRTSSSTILGMAKIENKERLPFALFFALFFAAFSPLLAGCSGGRESQESSEPQDAGGRTELTESGTPAAGDTGAVEQETTSANTGPVRVETSVIATGLEVPWGLAFTPDGEALVTERDSGRLLSVDSSGNTKELQ